MRIGICVAVLVLAGWVVNAAAELRLFAIPGNTTWADAKQGPLSEKRFIEVIDFKRYENGIGPITPVRAVPVPEIPLTLTANEMDAATDSSLFAFSLNVTRADVVAVADVELGDGEIVKAGTVLVRHWSPFPRSLEAVQLLRQAGIQNQHR